MLFKFNLMSYEKEYSGIRILVRNIGTFFWKGLEMYSMSDAQRSTFFKNFFLSKIRQAKIEYLSKLSIKFHFNQ